MDTSNDKVQLVLEGLRVPAQSMTTEEWWKILSVILKKIRPHVKELLGARGIGETLTTTWEDGVRRTNTQITRCGGGIDYMTRIFPLYADRVGHEEQQGGTLYSILYALLDHNGHLLVWREKYKNTTGPNDRELKLCKFDRLDEKSFETWSNDFAKRKEASGQNLGERIFREILSLFEKTINKKAERLNVLRTRRNELHKIFERIAS